MFFGKISVLVREQERKKKKQSIENEKYMEGGENRFERRGVVT